MYEPYEPYELFDSVVICPYNEQHKIARSRIQKHIVKCEKNYPKNYKLICPYNATHRLFESEMAEHILKCPMSRLVEPDLYEFQGVQKHGSTKFQLHADIASTINNDKSSDDEIDDNWQPCKNKIIPTAMNYLNVCTNKNSISKNNDIDDAQLRAPKGYSEVMMIDQNEDTYTDDIESVVSSMGVGRGRMNPNNAKLLTLIGIGRGRNIVL